MVRSKTVTETVKETAANVSLFLVQWNYEPSVLVRKILVLT
jgi:hypothetical protein